MENETSVLEPLIEKIGAYGKTSITLYKLKTLEKASSVTSDFFSRFIAALAFSLFVLMSSVAGAFWLGELTGKVYFGFLCIAGLYLVVGVILRYFFHTRIKNRINNSIISQVLN